MVNGTSVEPSRRVVLLGASNVTRGIASVLATCQQSFAEPLDVMCAIGHGRSFGRSSRVLGRRLPGILECGLWQELRRRTPLPLAALVTDIGNDILFGSTVETIASWVDESLRRLAENGAKLIVTELPLESVSQLSPRRFRLFRSLLFPKSTLEYAQAIANATELNARVVALAKQYEATLVKPRRDWYAVDPIHVRYRHFGSAWPELLGAWNESRQPLDVPHSWRLWWKLRTSRPLEQKLFGFVTRRTQPARVLRNGTRVSLY